MIGIEDDYDVAVFGAGPAGSVLARDLGRRGRRVLLAERTTFPRRKVCGACLGGHAVRELNAAGLGHVVTDRGAVPQTGFRLGVGGKTRRSAFVKTRGGFALSRAALDAALADEAAAAGATVRFGATAAVTDGGATLTGGGKTTAVRARAVAIACGLKGAGSVWSRDRQGVGPGDGMNRTCRLPDGRGSRLRSAPAPRSRVGAGCEVSAGTFDAAFFTPGTIHMAVAAGGYVGATVCENGELNLAGAFDLPALKANGGPPGAAAEIFRAAGFPVPPGVAAADWSGTPPLTRAAGDVAAGNVFLLGDAAGYVEPFTGEGMGWAVASANALGPILDDFLAGDDAAADRWRTAYRRRVGRRKRWCRTVARAARTPGAAGAAAAVLTRFPTAAVPLLRHLAG